MRFLSTRVHGVMDYLMCALLIASPWLFGFDRGGAETWIPVIIGAGGILYSLMTDYEMSATRRISMPTHLWLDLLAGAFLAVSPWLFNFDEFVYLPHLLFGLAEIGMALITKKVPGTLPHHDRAHTATVRAKEGRITTYRTGNATIIPSSRPPVGNPADARNRTESERAKKDL